MSAAPVVGVLVPCRDEAVVLPRKLANLSAAAWPDAARPHLVCVVDDGSRDDTARLAEEHAAEPTPYRLLVERNLRAPGKAGAIATGLDALTAEGVDLILLTDADVVFAPEGIAALARAFAQAPELAMACGAQTFVRDLASDGTELGADGAAPVTAGGLYDGVTARVRALESRFGRLFSVHGQMLAWRAALGLNPATGIAADDLDLMVQARAAGGRVRLIPDARFLEVKTPSGEARDAQALRRARAYFQVCPRLRPPAEAGLLDRAHFALYRVLPAAAPALAFASTAALLGGAFAFGGALGLAGAAVLAGALWLSPVGRRLGGLLRVIARARRVERREPISDRWEMERP